MWSISSKNEKSFAWIVLKGTPETFTNFMAGGFVACASGYTLVNFFEFATAGLGSPFTRKPRQKNRLPNVAERKTK